MQLPEHRVRILHYLYGINIETQHVHCNILCTCTCTRHHRCNIQWRERMDIGKNCPTIFQSSRADFYHSLLQLAYRFLFLVFYFPQVGSASLSSWLEKNNATVRILWACRSSFFLRLKRTDHRHCHMFTDLQIFASIIKSCIRKMTCCTLKCLKVTNYDFWHSLKICTLLDNWRHHAFQSTKNTKNSKKEWMLKNLFNSPKLLCFMPLCTYTRFNSVWSFNYKCKVKVPYLMHVPASCY